MTPPFDIVIPAAGTGTRMLASLQTANHDSDTQIPKQYLPLGGMSILERTLARLLEVKPRRICLVVSEHDQHWHDLPSAKYCEIEFGGETRADSVQAGLAKLNCEDEELVLVHDSVRPLVSAQSIQELITEAARTDAGAILATPVVDTLKYSLDAHNIDQTADRSDYWLAQTPQAFPAGLLGRALSEASKHAITVTDEASAVEALGLKPRIVASPKTNIKITTVDDLALAEFLLQREAEGRACE
jgi:2-C-methyl-D-erythritol 4-phosphate cytidylyltransferase